VVLHEVFTDFVDELAVLLGLSERVEELVGDAGLPPVRLTPCL
jgi:hypothetical protein